MLNKLRRRRVRRPRFTFSLGGPDRFSTTPGTRTSRPDDYRTQTRQGGANALNIWLVDFNYLGIATFPWDYASSPPSTASGCTTPRCRAAATNYNLGETATHEAGHWFGLYHTFQGGCTEHLNDEVADTPAQAARPVRLPRGTRLLLAAGLDPIHNYMDYSYDTCYDQFTPGQGSRCQPDVDGLPRLRSLGWFMIERF